MTNEQIKKSIMAVANELCKLELSGKHNWAIIMSCIAFLQKLCDGMTDEVETDVSET